LALLFPQFSLSFLGFALRGFGVNIDFHDTVLCRYVLRRHAAVALFKPRVFLPSQPFHPGLEVIDDPSRRVQEYAPP
jgi:hypothetical protein